MKKHLLLSYVQNRYSCFPLLIILLFPSMNVYSQVQITNLKLSEANVNLSSAKENSTGLSIEVVAFERTTNPVKTGKYEKLELGIKLPETINQQIADFISGKLSGLNPYDPDDVSIELFLQSPSGVNKTFYGFYYREFKRLPDSSNWISLDTEYPWRIRLALNETGTWNYSITTLINNIPLIVEASAVNNYFLCVPSGNPGYLEVGKHKSHLRFSGTGQSFFAIGENIAWPDEINTDNYWSSIPLEYQFQQNYFRELAAAGGNYARIVMAPWSSIVEWEQLGNYQQRQPHLWELDNIFDIAENNSIYIHLCMDMHSNYEDWTPYGVPVWAHNPYKTISGVNTVTDFLTNPTAKEIYKKRLRYLIARYGYSTSLAVYELTSEADKMGSNDSIGQYYSDSLFRKALGRWHAEMIHYIKHNLGGSNRLFSTSYAGEPHPDDFIYSLPDINITSRHRYGPNRNINLIYRYNELQHNVKAYPGKPFIFGEIGADPLAIDGCNAVSFHNAIWSTAFMGGFGTGLNWTWDQAIHVNGFQSHFTAISNFFKGVDFEADKFEPQRSDAERKVNLLCAVNCEKEDLPLEYLTLRNSDGSKALGWAHNRSFYWANIRDANKECFSSYTAPFDDDTLSTPRTISIRDNEPVIIRGLQSLKKYDVEIYSCYGNGEKLSSINGILSNVAGTLRFNYPFSNDVNGPNNFPDYAYKIYLSSSNFKSEEVEASILPPEILTCPIDTFYFKDITNENEMAYSYNWNFGNGQTSFLRNPKVYYNSPGTYYVKLIFTDRNGRRDSLMQTVVVPDCPSQKDSAFNSSTFTIYPNPNKGHFSIVFSSEIENQKPEVYFYNVFGSQVQKTVVNAQITTVDLSSHAKGLYLVKIIFRDKIVNQKIIYQ